MARLAAALVERLYRTANAGRWQLPIDRFVRALEASAAKAFPAGEPSARELERYLGSLRLDDLALASACAEGHEAAWDHFVLEYRPVLYRAADAIDPGGGARELADSLYADLFGVEVKKVRLKPDTTYLQDEGGRYPQDEGERYPQDEGGRYPQDEGERRSLFRYFHGRSSLATWLRAVLAQRQVDRVRLQARITPLSVEEPAAPATDAPDLDEQRYFALIHAALREAVARLESRDRLRLLYYYAHGLTLAQAGRLLREHEASVSRHLSAARKTIRRDVERQLREAGLAADEIARCFECVTEDAGPLDLDQLLTGSMSSAAARNPEPDVQSKGPLWKPPSPRIQASSPRLRRPGGKSVTP
jgi:RNA polymerase sigma factor (sigma-70 family)